MTRGFDGSGRTGSRHRLRLRRFAAAAAAVLVVAAVASCGGSSGPKKVAITLLAPTSGVTVNVHALVVYGTVTPATATVLVGRRHVAVFKGTFKQPLLMQGRVAHIRVSARAQGYEGARLEATVHYKPGPHSSSSSSGVATGIIGTSLASGGAPTTNAGLSLPTLVGTPSDRNSFISSCELSSHNGAMCTCLYDKLAASPQMQTRQQQYAFAAQLEKAIETGNSSDVPPVVRQVTYECSSQLAGGRGPP